MAKFNYFDALDSLSDMMVGEIRELFTAKGSTTLMLSPNNRTLRSKKEKKGERSSSEEVICSIEKILFSDFFPPLERADIASLAHSLGRVIDKTSAIGRGQSSQYMTEGEIYIKLAEMINENTKLLKKIRKADSIPHTEEFRRLISTLTDRQRALPPSLQALTEELSLCFDCLVEVMLDNI